MDEINDSGIAFENAIEDFSRWSGGENSVFLSWSNSDLYVLIDNFKKFIGVSSIDFIKKYADLQKYCQSFIKNNTANQISLANCAEIFDINADTENMHRALEDLTVIFRNLLLTAIRLSLKGLFSNHISLQNAFQKIIM